jgi:hypothetical protein
LLTFTFVVLFELLMFVLLLLFFCAFVARSDVVALFPPEGLVAFDGLPEALFEGEGLPEGLFPAEGLPEGLPETFDDLSPATAPLLPWELAGLVDGLAVGCRDAEPEVVLFP